VVASSSDVPALRRGLAVLRLIATRPGPISAATVARELGLPRSTTYHLLAELTDAGFVTHLPEERRYGLGVSAFEVGSAYLRHDPLERLARPLLRRFADRAGHTAHLGVLHGAETLYVVREQPAHPQSLVTSVGVRLPAQLPASGRAMLAHLPAAQIRALFPSKDSFVNRTGRGPRDLPSLRRVLSAERRRGWAVEDGYVTAGFASVAAPVFDHGHRPIAAISATIRHECAPECGETWPDLAAEVLRFAAEMTTRVGGVP
jgi:DNA-binding IclR family transcriptional regulator